MFEVVVKEMSKPVQDVDYAEVVIRHTKKMPPTSLMGLEWELKKICDDYTPKLKVRREKI